ncbi:hypothetical protein HK105_206048 [Polyrhizophydium stewartii]|uniref:C2H2-type domain-containing protein n=1 Tax=Polyrhizophydium stewartii TaxID=2732419 RepID=A0ABR4N4K9_9FUNG
MIDVSWQCPFTAPRGLSKLVLHLRKPKHYASAVWLGAKCPECQLVFGETDTAMAVAEHIETHVVHRISLPLNMGESDTDDDMAFADAAPEPSVLEMLSGACDLGSTSSRRSGLVAVDELSDLGDLSDLSDLGDLECRPNVSARSAPADMLPTSTHSSATAEPDDNDIESLFVISPAEDAAIALAEAASAAETEMPDALSLLRDARRVLEPVQFARFKDYEVEGVDSVIGYCLPSDAIATWLLSPRLSAELAASFAQTTQPHMGVDVRDNLEQLAKQAEARGAYGSMADGSAWLQTLADSRPRWVTKYDAAVAHHVPVRFVRLVLSAKQLNLGGGDGQMLLILSAGEFPETLCAESKSLATLPIALVSQALLKALAPRGGLHFVLDDLLTRDLETLADGVLYTDGDERTLVFAYIHVVCGDMLACSRLAGISPALDAQLPCTRCYIFSKELAMMQEPSTSILKQQRNQPAREPVVEPDRRTTRPGICDSEWRETLCMDGLCVPSVMLFWPLGLRPQSIAVEVKDQLFGGMCGPVLDALAGTIMGSDDRESERTFWSWLSHEFGMFCRLNHISSSCTFGRRAKAWRGMDPAGVPLLLAASSMLLDQTLSQQGSSDTGGSGGSDEQSARSRRSSLGIVGSPQLIEDWVRLALISKLVSARRITRDEIDALDQLFDGLLRWIYNKEQRRVLRRSPAILVQAHYLCHLRSQITAYGPLRGMSGFVTDAAVAELKHYWRQALNASRCKSAMAQFYAGVGIELVRQWRPGQPGHGVLLHRRPMDLRGVRTELVRTRDSIPELFVSARRTHRVGDRALQRGIFVRLGDAERVGLHLARIREFLVSAGANSELFVVVDLFDPIVIEAGSDGWGDWERFKPEPSGAPHLAHADSVVRRLYVAETRYGARRVLAVAGSD